MKIGAKFLIGILTYSTLAGIEQISINNYDNWQTFRNSELIEFYEKILSKNHTQAARILCKNHSSFLWYTAKICGEYHSDSPGCPSPNIDITYVGLKPLLLPEFVANADREHILGQPLVRIGSDSKICRVFPRSKSGAKN